MVVYVSCHIFGVRLDLGLSNLLSLTQSVLVYFFKRHVQYLCTYLAK